MKHIALRSKSMRAGDRPYTCPGLGDRLHEAFKSFQYGAAHKTKVTMHLTSDKYGKPHKKKSWAEIMDLFPENSIDFKVWDVCNLPENEWLKYLEDQGIKADLCWYKDTKHMHPNDFETAIEISEYLKNPVLLEPSELKMMDSKYVTVQWNSTDPARNISSLLIDNIHGDLKNKGYEVVDIGEDPTTPLAKLSKILYNAKYHIGVDSGLMHLAMMYKKFKDIVIYNKVGGFVSHHLVRAKKNGVKIVPV